MLTYTSLTGFLYPPMEYLIAAETGYWGSVKLFSSFKAIILLRKGKYRYMAGSMFMSFTGEMKLCCALQRSFPWQLPPSSWSCLSSYFSHWLDPPFTYMPAVIPLQKHFSEITCKHFKDWVFSFCCEVEDIQICNPILRPSFSYLSFLLFPFSPFPNAFPRYFSSIT